MLSIMASYLALFRFCFLAFFKLADHSMLVDPYHFLVTLLTAFSFYSQSVYDFLAIDVGVYVFSSLTWTIVLYLAVEYLC